MSGTVLVTGATGNTGRPLVELLSRRGVSVRVMVRSAAACERLICLVSAGWDMNSRCAARVRFPSSATATK